MKVCINIDVSRHPLTLGGALTLRQEGEMISKISLCKKVDVYFSEELDKSYKEKIWRNIFKSSTTKFVLSDKPLSETINWPPRQYVELKDFSFHSFSRVNLFHKNFNILPRLNWKIELITKALTKLPNKKRIICVHLKNIDPFMLEESNVASDSWKCFFDKTLSIHPEILFVLVGDDEVDQEIRSLKNVALARDMSLSLAEQLAIIGEVDGFLGLASGICTAANFSHVPHVILKHPKHDPEEIFKEIGSGQSFPFSQNLQFLWRKPQTAEIIGDALKVIMN